MPHHYEQIRQDNLLAERTAEACAIMHEMDRPYAVEQPTPFKGAVTMFQFDSFSALVHRGARLVHFDQCMHGALSKKPTTILHGHCDFSSLAAFCNHPKETQTNEDGSTYMAPHPSYVGRKRANGKYLTSDLAAYSGKLNCRLATLFEATLVNSPSDTS